MQAANPQAGAGQPAPALGKPRLYIPDELFNWSAAGARLGPGQFPDHTAALFPCRPPLDYQGNELVRRRFTWRPLFQAPLRTRGSSHTKLAQGVANMGVGPGRLQFVYRSSTLWNKLKMYAQGPGHQPLGTQPMSPGGYPQGVNAPLVRVWPNLQPPAFTRSAWTEGGGMAHAEQQTHAICALAELYSTWLREWDVPMIVNSEPAVQDAFYRQLLIPLEHTMLTRFQVTSTGASWNSWDLGSRLNVPQTMYPSPVEISQELHQGHIRYPFWGRSVSLEQAAPQAGTKKAGFPDFILYNKPDHEGNEHAAIGEVKTFWSYETQEIANLWRNGGIAHDIPNHVCTYDWATADLENDTLKQLWGEIRSLKTRFAFWTNGEAIMLCIVTNDAENAMELTCTPFYYLRNNPDVPIVLAGFAFAAMNHLRGMDIISDLVRREDKCY